MTMTIHNAIEQQRPIYSSGGRGNSPNTRFDTFDSLLVYSADSMAMETNDINNSAIIIVVPRIQYMTMALHNTYRTATANQQ